MTITKMVLLNKFKDEVKDLESYVLVEDLQKFVGTEVLEFQVETNSFVSVGKVTSIDIDQETGSLKVNDNVSFYDDFDFDFTVVDGVQTPKGIVVLEIDANAPALLGDPVDPEEPEEPVEPVTGLETGDGDTLVNDEDQPIVID